MLERLSLLAVAVLGFFAMLWRGQSKQHAAEAQRQTERADSADASIKQVQQTNAALEEVDNTQREERIDAEAHFDNGDRDQLDNRW